jgi:hypothetical protein
VAARGQLDAIFLQCENARRYGIRQVGAFGDWIAALYSLDLRPRQNRV